MTRTEVAARAAAGTVRMPRLVGSDMEHRLLVLEYLSQSRTGTEAADDDEFDTEMCESAAEQLAAFHRLPPAEFDTTPHPLPPLAGLSALSLDRYLSASGGELDMWRLLQGDEQLVDALIAMRAGESAPEVPRCPIHGDLRLDQFLLTGQTLFLSDFEESRVGDPARDIGAFAGEWLYRAIAALPATLASSVPIGHTATHEEIIATGVGEISARSPFVRSFYRKYLACAESTVDAELATRAAAYAGWHMLDRMLASAVRANRLSPINLAAAGIGRSVLLSPAEFTESLGLVA
jgi:hypothetical protein